MRHWWVYIKITLKTRKQLFINICPLVNRLLPGQSTCDWDWNQILMVIHGFMVLVQYYFIRFPSAMAGSVGISPWSKTQYFWQPLADSRQPCQSPTQTKWIRWGSTGQISNKEAEGGVLGQLLARGGNLSKIPLDPIWVGSGYTAWSFLRNTFSDWVKLDRSKHTLGFNFQTEKFHLIPSGLDLKMQHGQISFRNTFSHLCSNKSTDQESTHVLLMAERPVRNRQSKTQSRSDQERRRLGKHVLWLRQAR